jgi:hypothetical protein
VQGELDPAQGSEISTGESLVFPTELLDKAMGARDPSAFQGMERLDR